MSKRGSSAATALSAIGVVFGDIGTSPLYAISLLFLNRRSHLTPDRIMGGISLVVWSLVIVVAVKYAMLALRADNDGEGGVFALYGLLDRVNRGGRSLLAWALLLGAGLLLGDGMITPAISVLSAVEGLSVVTPVLAGAVLPVTLALLAALFLVQHRGTGQVGKVFGPIMLVWFVGIALLGGWQILRQPHILWALSPIYGIRLLAGSSIGTTLRILGAVMLAVTGCEAMYADMGHFGASAIRKGWFALVFPALLLNYLGQGALLLAAPGLAGDGLFFRMVPQALVLPWVLLATMATVIASQALISGTFSLITQGIALNFFPRLAVLHTDKGRVGEVYVPFFNWLLFAGCVALVLAFRSSIALGSAYGLAVSGVMLVTSAALWRTATRLWQWNRLLAAVTILPLALVDAVFLFANSLKILDGGYVPLGIGLAVFGAMLTWNWGRRKTRGAYIARRTVTMDQVAERHRNAQQFIERTAVLMVPPRANIGRHNRAPTLLHLLWSRNGILPRNIIFVGVVHLRQPYVHEDRLSTQVLEQNANGSIVAVEMRFGFMEEPNVELGLEQLAAQTRIALETDHRKWSVHVAHEHLVHTPRTGVLSALRFHTFELLRLISQPTYYHYGLGHDVQLTVEILPVRLS
jgi:KUP system potassium uptake protein